MFCTQCSHSLPNDAHFCSACGRPVNLLPPVRQTRLVRPRQDRAIAGVCSGFALAFGWDVTATRVVFAVLTLLTSGLGLLVYLGAWILMPDAYYALPPVPPQQQVVPNGTSI